MSQKIKVNTNEVLLISKKIDKANQELSLEFKKLSQKITGLRISWQSKAGDKVIQSFTEINKQLYNQEKVLNDYSRLLSNNVAQGGETIEEFNISLADAFQ